MQNKAFRVLLIYKTRSKELTNTLRLFGDPEEIRSDFSYNNFRNYFYLHKVKKLGLIYREI